MKVKFRTADCKDLPELNKISITSKRYWGYPEQWINLWLEDLRLTSADLKDQNVLIMESEGKNIGFSALKDQDDHYEITHLWILPEFIGKGYGRMLLKHTINTNPSINKPIWVQAEPKAKSFYEKHGFVVFDLIESLPKGRFLPLMRKVIF